MYIYIYCPPIVFCCFKRLPYYAVYIASAGHVHANVDLGLADKVSDKSHSDAFFFETFSFEDQREVFLCNVHLDGKQ